MRPAIKRGIGLLTCGLLMMSVGIATAQTAPVGAVVPQCVAMVKTSATAPDAKAVAPQVHHDARTNTTFFYSLTSDGGVRITASAGDLEVDKVVYPDGRSRIVLGADNDRVSLTIGVGEVNVERRGAGRMQVDVPRATEAEWLQVKVLLAGSKALRRFRALASSLDAPTLKTPSGAAVVLSDAVLGHLDGDVGAVGRLMQQMRAAVQARIRPVRVAVPEEDCWHTYEQQTVHALDDYESCRKMFWFFDPRQEGCLFVWGIQAEAAWVQLISCSGLHLAVGG
jgi:hypothetical protein